MGHAAGLQRALPTVTSVQPLHGGCDGDEVFGGRTLMGNRYYVTDTDLSERFPIYTRANVGEVFPDPVTPLTSDTALWGAELGWRDGWVRIGAFDEDEFPADQFCQLG